MKIGVDISQLAYANTGVARYLANLLDNLLKIDDKNEYIFFYSSLRRKLNTSDFGFLGSKNAILMTFKFPPSLLDFLWNRLHTLPIENLIGDIDVFITSDWTEPPSLKAKKATVLYDLIVYKHPGETAKKIVDTQKRKLKWVKRESAMVFCISASTKKDALETLGIEEKKITVIYPGV